MEGVHNDDCPTEALCSSGAAAGAQEQPGGDEEGPGEEGILGRALRIYDSNRHNHHLFGCVKRAAQELSKLEAEHSKLEAELQELREEGGTVSAPRAEALGPVVDRRRLYTDCCV